MNIEPRTLVLSVSATVVLPMTTMAVETKTDVLVETMTVSATQASTQQLNTLIEIALKEDGVRKQISAQSQAMRETGVASATLMDPKLKVGFGGLPVDSFQFDQDPMTNISVGLMQQFERGSTLSLQQQKLNQQADGLMQQVQVREREVGNSMTQLWLELGYQQVAERTLKENIRLMHELEQFIESNYSLGVSEAQDLLNAQLQVSKLDEKLQANAQMQRRLISQLSEWLGDEWLLETGVLTASNQLNWDALQVRLAPYHESMQFYPLLNQHPMLIGLESGIAANKTQVEVAEQAYTPQFGVEVMYANRQANGMGGEPASDLVSAYLTMDIPLFTGKRQDRNLAAAQHQVGAARAQKEALLRQMNARVNALIVDRTNFQQRIERYQNVMIPQSKARTQAVERGYQNSTAQFSDVISALNDELALQLELQRLYTDLNITHSQLSALVGGFGYQAHEQPNAYKHPSPNRNSRSNESIGQH